MHSQGEPIRTIGHGTRTTDELVSELRSAGVETVIDIRRYPLGRRQPQFASERLMVDLPAHGIAYEAWSDELGGRRPAPPPAFVSEWKTPGLAAYAAYTAQPAFRAALARLESRADHGEAIAIMCAETLWWRCHRRLIANELVRDGFQVVHLRPGAKRVPHQWPQNRSEPDRRTSPGAPAVDEERRVAPG